MVFPFRVRPRRAAGVRRRAARAPLFRRLARRHPAGARSIARPPTSAARATVRTRSCRPRRTWSCGTKRCGADVHRIGIFTLPEMELPFGEMEPLMDEIGRVAYEIIGRDKFLVDARRRALDHGAARLGSGAQVSRMCRSCRSMRTPICARATWARATTTPARCGGRCEFAPLTQVGIRSLSPRKPRSCRRLKTTIFYDVSMREDPRGSIASSIRSATEVYVSIDVDGMDPAIMPATGTPEPGGLSWTEITGAAPRHRRARRVVACDVVELSPIPGMVAPNFLCAKLVYKLLTYRFATILGPAHLAADLQARIARRPPDPNGTAGCIRGILPPPCRSLTLDSSHSRPSEGHGADAATSAGTRGSSIPGLTRDETPPGPRAALAEAWLLQDDIRQATEALGRSARRARAAASRPAVGAVAAARQAGDRPGEPSRGIAFLGRALKQAERAHDSRAIGLAHYELGLCYRQVGDTAIVREHIAQAASALHAAGDLRHLALVHSLSGVTLAQEGRLDEAMAALRQAERLAMMVRAGDVVATVCGNQANVAMMQHRHEQALALAERSVELQEEAGTPHGLGIALASLGQICVRLGNLDRAEEALNRALDVRSPLQFMRETTGAVFDTLAQIHLIRGNHEDGEPLPPAIARGLRRIWRADQPWYQWSVQVLEARVALRRGDAARALAHRRRDRRGRRVPPAYATQAELIAVEALLASGRLRRGRGAARAPAARLDPAAGMSGVVGGVPPAARARCTPRPDADRGVPRPRPERQRVRPARRSYQAGLSYLELGKLAGAGRRAVRARRDT